MGLFENSDNDSAEKVHFQSPLPGNAGTWESSFIMAPDRWPFYLQNLTVTIAHLDYPCAIFWGQDLTLLYNQAWLEFGGIGEQGRAQRGSLPSDAWHPLWGCITDGKASRITSSALLIGNKSPGNDERTVLVSPLFDTEAEKPKGAIAQMICTTPSSPGPPKPKVVQNPIQSGYDLPGRSFSSGKQQSTDTITRMSPSNFLLDEHRLFHSFAEMLPTGLAILDHNAHAVSANKHFHRLTTHRAADKSFLAWPESIHPDDSERVLSAYQNAFMSQAQLRIEFRVFGAERPWRLLHLTPLADEKRRHIGLPNYDGSICSVVDITSGKNEEESQRQAAVEAEERKQQQERFIDMISHEVRNPLSAVLHCVEDIDGILRESGSKASEVDKSQIFETLETINLCISQQKNIVDDVLSYSKLDSSMISLAPTPSQPDPELRRFLRMFQPELRKRSIYFEYFVDTGYVELEVDWAMADLARISQVVTNLISNAIKFTSRKDRKEGEKRITCKLSASAERPRSYPPDVVFFNSEQHVYRLDATERPEWGDGQAVYIMVSICDNGIGIKDEEQKKLFERFKQATPRTQDIYGGSGLGLNISRKLVHLHGGEIGVASKEGKGATFGFFFRVKRTNTPENADSDEDAIGVENRLRDQIRAQGLEAMSELDSKEAEGLPKRQPIEDREREVWPGERTQHSAKLWREQEEEGKRDRSCDGKDKEQYCQGKHSEESGESVLERTRNACQSLQPDNNITSSTKIESEHDISESKATQGSKASQLTQESPTPPSAERNRILNQGHEPIHVLVVEDNIINQRIVQRKLIAKGFRVSTANNGQEAVDRYTMSYTPAEFEVSPEREKLRAIDVILMDQEMPVMDGNAATRMIRSLERKRQEEGGDEKRVPILGVSANVREEQLEGMTRSGMDSCITKPYKMDSMVWRIYELLRK